MNGGDDGRVLDAIEKVDNRLRELVNRINAQFMALDSRFMPREQLTDRFDAIKDVHVSLAKEIQDVDTRVTTDQTLRSTQIRFVITTAIAALVAVVAVATFLVIYVSHH